MPCGDGEADLVVELSRCRDVAFLLDVESHAGGPDRIAATLRTDGLGDNYPGGQCPCANCTEPLGVNEISAFNQGDFALSLPVFGVAVKLSIVG